MYKTRAHLEIDYSHTTLGFVKFVVNGSRAEKMKDCFDQLYRKPLEIVLMSVQVLYTKICFL